METNVTITILLLVQNQSLCDHIVSLYFLMIYFFKTAKTNHLKFKEAICMNNQKRAKQFFLLGEQYSETAQLLLDILIHNGNSNCGIGSTMEEALEEMEKNASKSDLYLFIPAIFNCLQSTELFIKGLLLLANKEFKWQHDIKNLLYDLESIYKVDSKIYVALNTFYEKQISIINRYKTTNNITKTSDLYMSLRYPEIRLHVSDDAKDVMDITVNYSDLICNGKLGIEQFKELQDNLNAIKLAVVEAYNTKCPI